MIRIVVIDDHQLFRQGVITLLNETSDIQVVGDAGNEKDALRLIRELTPDIAVLDISLGKSNGIQIGKNLRAKGNKIGLVIVTMQTDPSYFKTAREEANVDGYVLKLDAFDELAKAVRAAYRGEKFLSPSLAAKMAWTDDAVEDHDGLTPREREVIKMVVVGYSSFQIGDQLNISKRTVDTYRANIREKLQLSSTAELVRYAIRKGMIKP